MALGLALGLGFNRGGPAGVSLFDPMVDATGVVAIYDLGDLSSLDDPDGPVGEITNLKGDASNATASGSNRGTSGLTTLNGRNGLRLDGVDDRYTVTLPALSAGTVMVVGVSTLETIPANNSQVVLATSNSGSNQAGFALRGKDFASSSILIFNMEGAATNKAVRRNGFSGTNDRIYVPNQPFIAFGSWDGNQAQTDLRIGAFKNNNNYGKYDLFYVIIFDHVLTDDERYKMEWWLSTRFGIVDEMEIRPRWTITKIGEAIQTPPEMSGVGDVGPYYSQIVNMTAVPNFPFDYACYFSSDHSGSAGGIYLYMTNTPEDETSWVSYSDAVTNGDFDYLVSKPSANPIYIDTTLGDQTETPWIMVFDDAVVLTYQNSGAGNNQSTVRALGTDGVNFTRDQVVVDYVSGESLGNGHTGYFQAGPNPGLEGFPYAYVGYSLHGGGGRPIFAQWGCNDPRTEVWTETALLHWTTGRVKVGSFAVGWNSIDPLSFERTHDGNWSVICTMITQSAGGGLPDGAVYDLLLDPTGTQVLRKPTLILPRGGAGTFDAKFVGLPRFIPHGSNYIGVYDAISGSGVRSTGSASAAKTLEKPYVFYRPLTPAIPAYTETVYDFTAVSALPLGLSTQSAGAVAPTTAYTANGLEVTGQSGSPNSQLLIFSDTGFVPNDVDYFEMWIEGWKSLTTSTRIPYFGIASSKDLAAAITDGYIINNGGSTGVQAVRNTRIASANTASTDAWYTGFGYNSADAAAPKRIGFRWFCDTGALYFTGESAQEYDSATLSGSFNKTLTYYPFIGVEFRGSPGSECFEKLCLRIGTP